MTIHKSFYITTPIYYVNGPPHFAHAYTTVASDVLARFHRLDGQRVVFVTGTDEHGQKVAQAAREKGLPTQDFCDAVSAEFQAMCRLMNISNDDFIRTTEDRHIRACRTLWQSLDAAGEIYPGRFGGWYSVRDEAYFDEAELVDGQAPTGAPVEWVEEDNYFFRLSAWQDRLLKFYDDNPNFIAPASRRNEVMSFVRAGLRDLSISRTTFNWGIPVPGAPSHVMYVWLDALTNYLTAAGYPDAATDVWPADIHMVGKDIIRFHCVYWPAFLMAAGIQPPARVYAHGWWTVEGRKMSKSLNNFIPPQELVERHGIDAVRYFMIRELPFGGDGDMSRAAIGRRATGELANELGNLAFRTLTMIERYLGGVLPLNPRLRAEDERMAKMPSETITSVRSHMESQALQAALLAVWRIVADANRYVQDAAPWTHAASDPDRMVGILWALAETLRGLGILLQPFIPDAAGRLLDMLAVPPGERSFAALHRAVVPAGVRLPVPQVLFTRRNETDPD